jgi:GTP cyclohydrolase IA
MSKPANLSHEELQAAVTTLIRGIGENPNREGLLETPKRYVKAMAELTSGYLLTAEQVLGTTFDAESYDEIVVLKDVEFTSLCEHHLLPFTGTVDIGYIPRDKIVGLSKLARLADMHARRLQVQERMTSDIAQDLERVIRPVAAAVVVEAHHACMGCRGVRKPGARMVTSKLLGKFRTTDAARAEVFKLFGRG